MSYSKKYKILDTSGFWTSWRRWLIMVDIFCGIELCGGGKLIPATTWLRFCHLVKVTIMSATKGQAGDLCAREGKERGWGGGIHGQTVGAHVEVSERRPCKSSSFCQRWISDRPALSTFLEPPRTFQGKSLDASCWTDRKTYNVLRSDLRISTSFLR